MSVYCNCTSNTSTSTTTTSSVLVLALVLLFLLYALCTYVAVTQLSATASYCYRLDTVGVP